MLSEREARSLRDIEQRLTRDDERFAALMDTSAFDRRERRMRHGYDVVLALAVLAAMICVALAGDGSLSAGMLALGFALATGYLRIRRFPIHRSPRERQPR